MVSGGSRAERFWVATSCFGSVEAWAGPPKIPTNNGRYPGYALSILENLGHCVGHFGGPGTGRALEVSEFWIPSRFGLTWVSGLRR